MKYLVVFAVLLVVYLIWRSQRAAAERPPRAPAPPPAGQPQDMVQCPVCSLHLPRGEALIGTNGQAYCSKEHRLRAGEQP
jgi:uncharacterized protein